VSESGFEMHCGEKTEQSRNKRLGGGPVEGEGEIARRPEIYTILY